MTVGKRKVISRIRATLSAALLTAALCVEPCVHAESWALVNMSVACVREKPGHPSELGTQAMMGTPIRILSERDGWCEVETPDGYHGYVLGLSLHRMSVDDMSQWRKSSRVMVMSADEVIARDPETGRAVTDLVGGCLLQGLWGDGICRVYMPDGRSAVVPDSCVVTVENWAAQEFDPGRAVAFAERLMGRPYLWGGMSTKALDCSGLTSLSYYVAEGLILPRNASQQHHVGAEVQPDAPEQLCRGDLITFGNAKTGRVNHVAIFDSGTEYINSSGRVRRDSFDPQSPLYVKRNILGIRRITPETIGKTGAVRAYDHPWYFDSETK